MISKSLKWGYEIQLQKGSLQPEKIYFWKSSKDYQKALPTHPTKYLPEALFAWSFIQLNSFFKSPLYSPYLPYEKAKDLWTQYEPHYELYYKSSLGEVPKDNNSNANSVLFYSEFEKNFLEKLEATQTPWGVELSPLCSLLDCLNDLEIQMNMPLLYNRHLCLTQEFQEKALTLYSLLFSLRGTIAYDYNAQQEDPSHEALKLDSIEDYLPHPHFIVNDTLLIMDFMKFAQPWENRLREVTQGEHPVEKLFIEPFKRSLKKYSHNSFCLYQNLPENLKNSSHNQDLEEELYRYQMQWLLSSPSGLLFRLREELYGLKEGYDKIFWQDLPPENCDHPTKIIVSNAWQESAGQEKKVA